MTVPLLSAIEALLAPEARHENDRSTFRDLDVRRHREALPAGVELTWLGTAAFRLTFEGFDLLVDPYVTRAGIRRTFGRRPLRPNLERVATHLPKADAILVGHTHFDHVLDVPVIARRSGTVVYGSKSLARLMSVYGLGDRAVEVDFGRVYAIGPFEVTFVESTHSKLAAGRWVPFDGELTCDQLDDLRGPAYRCGQVYGIHIRVAGVSFYHQGSADCIDDRVVHRGVDYFLCGIAGRGFTPRYVPRILGRLSPRVVIPHHFDDFFRPLEAAMGFSLNVNLGGFVEEVRRVSADFAVRTMPLARVWKA